MDTMGTMETTDTMNARSAVGTMDREKAFWHSGVLLSRKSHDRLNQQTRLTGGVRAALAESQSKKQASHDLANSVTRLLRSSSYFLASLVSFVSQ